MLLDATVEKKLGKTPSLEAVTVSQDPHFIANLAFSILSLLYEPSQFILLLRAHWRRVANTKLMVRRYHGPDP